MEICGDQKKIRDGQMGFVGTIMGFLISLDLEVVIAIGLVIGYYLLNLLPTK